MAAIVSTNPVNLSKEFLLEIGGWRVMQEAQVLLEGGKVLNWTYHSPLLSGVVQSGTSTVNARLKVGTRLSDVENLCSCRQAREYGTVCPHVIAVGLRAMKEQNSSLNTSPSTLTPSTNVVPASETPATPRIKFASIASAPPGSKLLQLTVLLPLDFPAGWKQGKMRIILEGAIDGAPSIPLDAVPREEGITYSVYELDKKLLRFLGKICGGETPGMWTLEHDKFTEFFDILIGHEKVMLGKKSTAKIIPASEPSQITIEVLENGDMHLHLEQKSQLPGEYLFALDSTWHWQNDQLELLGKLPQSYRLLRNRDVVLPRTAIGHFFQNELPQLERHIKVVLGERCQKLRFEKTAPHIRMEIDGMLSGLSCKIEAVYGSMVHLMHSLNGKTEHSHNGWTPDPQDPLVYFVRDREAEQAVQRQVLAAGFQPGQRNAEYYTLSSENKVGAFLANVLPRWKTKWEVVFSARTQGFFEKCDFIRPEITIQSSGQDWLSMSIEFNNSGGETLISREEVQRLLQMGVSHHRLDNGRIILLPIESVQQFNEALFDCQVETEKDGWKINKRFGNYLQGILQIGDWKISQKSNWWPVTDLKDYEELALPEQMQATLRGYQKIGVNWLHYLTRNNLAGILADEMGLGKTIQSLAWFEYRKNNKLSSKPTLVVCPTSLIQNWFSESKRFTPGLSVLTLHGANRHQFLPQIPQYDMVVTSYALLRRDIAELQKFEFDSVVLDEAQNIKNRASLNAQCAKVLNAANRLVLTGTPMENSLLDLWSIFDFLMPGYLGPAPEFRDRYEIPIAKNADDKALARLQQRIRPFVLRRTKEDVARDLPAKLEQIAFCELTDEQKSVYQSILEQSRREVFENAGVKENSGKRRLAVLTALTRLRQVCCHLEMLPQVNQKEWNEPSSKMNYFFELLHESISGGHRVLVFSQFVSLLKLVETQIKKAEIEYCYMDGATTERQAVIDKFQNSPNISAFLISLKAGGTGLNLTGADTVIHFDPWWNPAVEDQATARAHRMGQSRIVTSYKLIARGTVEEKIVQLQQKKKALISSAIVGEEAFVRSLSWEELQGLLEA